METIHVIITCYGLEGYHPQKMSSNIGLWEKGLWAAIQA
jgi:hypothetical protein